MIQLPGTTDGGTTTDAAATPDGAATTDGANTTSNDEWRETKTANYGWWSAYREEKKTAHDAPDKPSRARSTSPNPIINNTQPKACTKPSRGRSPSSRPLEEFTDPSLKREWTIYFSEQHNKPWWYCEATNEIQWTMPLTWTSFQDNESGHLCYANAAQQIQWVVPIDSQQLHQDSTSREQEWTIYTDEDTLKTWWYCETTGEISWTVPSTWTIWDDNITGRKCACKRDTEYITYFIT